jgi:hypothetical protein
MPFPCRAHAVPLPCRAAKCLDCVFPIWFTQCGRVWFTHAMPRTCHATTMPFWKRLLKATAQRGMGMGMACVNFHRPSRDGMWATCPRSASSGYHAEFHEGYQKHTNPLNCRTSSLGYFRLPRWLSRRTRHCRRMAGACHGMAGERHGRGMCELALAL